MSVILKNARYIDWKTLGFSNTNIVVEEGKNGSIKFYNDFSEIPDSVKDEIIDCNHNIVTKSFAIAHHHVYSALARGMPAPRKTPSNFPEILKYIWWNIDRALDKDMIEASALATAIACAKAGTTFIIDHHASPNFIDGSLEIINEAFEKVGVSSLLCYEVTDRDGMDKAQQGLEETEKFLNEHQGLVGLHASFTIGNTTLKHSVDLMQKTNSGIHIHVAEDYHDQKFCLQNYNKHVVERLNDYGVLNSSKSILVHCLHLQDHERDIISNSPAYVAQNTESNLKNSVGYFNSKGFDNKIMLGTDGMHSDILRSAKAAYLVGQSNDEIDMANAYSRLREVHNYLSTNNFKGDGPNNLVVLDYDTPTALNEDNFLGHFIFGLTSNHVQHVISAGKLIVKDKIMLTVNEDEVLNFTKEQSIRLWSKL